jgi:hypothetical protein
MRQGIVFAERCPRCNREQAQEGYTVVNVQKRVELGEIVAALAVTRSQQAG